MKIGVIDYGMGNLFSVEQALERLNCEVVVSATPHELAAADALILPGVGAFPDAMKRLSETGLDGFIREQVDAGKQLLGICLGMQLLFEESEEVAPTKGFGFFNGKIARFSGETTDGIQYRVPHMGWNTLDFKCLPKWLEDINLPESKYVYFVHSFYATHINREQLVASAEYFDAQVPGVMQADNVCGMQFHPEKSGEFGVFLLEQWLKGVEVLTC
ncbi:imidazole glycerol phosphate synthase subunit HisH [Ureibacillus sinduriensis]|uniref:Imidazole glycerol phosphate synthase subunit HisH n=1 Tax=Ureibacillus sinduriensis BLB-1 = JCM 15800 TaxID=1384057 RepID=A0A0A3HTD2_9BACL|nr:imidazole glycerol phosphate synthase subunit HisH [Ureibacillus sinduriensis]KGR75811.1 imidazole glycerol phosphate synthase [Ureibacillus sinduriensis BLB-1 = JCM 15800]